MVVDWQELMVLERNAAATLLKRKTHQVEVLTFVTLFYPRNFNTISVTKVNSWGVEMSTTELVEVFN